MQWYSTEGDKSTERWCHNVGCSSSRAIELIISIWLEQQYKSGDGKPRITTLCQNVNVQEK